MKLAIALDLKETKDNVDLTGILIGAGLDFSVKIGPHILYKSGKSIIDILNKRNLEVCADVKLYDIPTAMARTAVLLAEAGASMITIHASCGEAGMVEVAQALDKRRLKAKLLAVTVLTSLTNSECYTVYGSETSDQVESLAALAVKSGMDGIVCSAHECGTLKTLAPDMIFYVPGIRDNEEADEHHRVASLELAFKNGADYAVIGRPIYTSGDPLGKALQFRNKLNVLQVGG